MGNSQNRTGTDKFRHLLWGSISQWGCADRFMAGRSPAIPRDPRAVMREPLGGGRADRAADAAKQARPRGGRGTHQVHGRRPLTRTMRAAPD